MWLPARQLDIYRAAKLVIDQHGDNALIEAAQMIDLMRANGYEEGRLSVATDQQAIETL